MINIHEIEQAVVNNGQDEITNLTEDDTNEISGGWANVNLTDSELGFDSRFANAQFSRSF
jgi:hypothetical protein